MEELLIVKDKAYGEWKVPKGFLKKDDRIHLLIDGNNLVYRMFFATKENPRKAVYHVYGFLRKLSTGFNIDLDIESSDLNIQIFWDNKSNWRKKLYLGYKGSRKDKYDEDTLEGLYATMDSVKEFSTFTHTELKWFEADDLISAYIYKVLKTKQGRIHDVKSGSVKRFGHNWDLASLKRRDIFVIVSNDKDMMQLIRDKKMYNVSQLKVGKKWNLIDQNIFVNKWGVEPQDFLSILALWGDASDSLKGVKGIGEKKATVLIKELGDVRDWLFGCHFRKSIKKELRKDIKRCMEQKEVVKRNLLLMNLRRKKILNMIDFKKNLFKVEL